MSMSVGKNKPIKHTSASQCFGCSQFLAVKKRFESQLKFCSNMPGVISKFKNQNLVSYEDNLKYMGNLPFVAYFDFETTTGSSSKILIEEEEMSPISYCLILSFHPKLKIDRLVVVRRFQHTLDQLNNSYLNSKIIEELH